MAYDYYSYFTYLLCLLLNFTPPTVRNFILKLLLGRLGKGSSIDYGFRFRYPKRISVGHNVVISSSCVFYPGFLIKDSRIEIGDDVIIAPEVLIIGAGHDSKNLSDVGGKIVISKGAYIGARSIIRYGVTIGENSVIGAGSIVTKSVPPNTLFIQKRKN